MQSIWFQFASLLYSLRLSKIKGCNGESGQWLQSRSISFTLNRPRHLTLCPEPFWTDNWTSKTNLKDLPPYQNEPQLSAHCCINYYPARSINRFFTFSMQIAWRNLRVRQLIRNQRRKCKEFRAKFNYSSWTHCRTAERTEGCLASKRCSGTGQVAKSVRFICLCIFYGMRGLHINSQQSGWKRWGERTKKQKAPRDPSAGKSWEGRWFASRSRKTGCCHCRWCRSSSFCHCCLSSLRKQRAQLSIRRLNDRSTPIRIRTVGQRVQELS